MKKVLLAAAVLALMAAPAMAAVPSTLGAGQGGVNTNLYHSYDGLVCTDCHTLHNSIGGVAVAGTKGGAAAGPFQNLLKKGDYTDICLSCHKDGYNTSATADMNNVTNSGWTAPIVMTLNGIVPTGKAMPAGDFFYSTNPAQRKGHNPSWTKNAVAPTSVLLPGKTGILGHTPPGVTDLTSQGGNNSTAGLLNSDGIAEWSCHSCHGMHSRYSDDYTAWRQLQRKINGVVTTGNLAPFGVEQFTSPKNVQNAAYEAIKSNSRGYVDVVTNAYVKTRADGSALDAADLFASEGDTNKNMYRGGFSSFCSACHGNFHGGNTENGAGSSTGYTRALFNGAQSWLRHPTNIKLGDATAQKYGTAGYTKQVKDVANALPNGLGYDWKYPLVKPDTDYAVTPTLAAAAVAGTVTNNDRIMCLTCHKAHATPYANMTRFDSTGHAFIAAATIDPTTGVAYKSGIGSSVDNIAYGCGKCHQKGGGVAFK